MRTTPPRLTPLLEIGDCHIPGMRQPANFLRVRYTSTLKILTLSECSQLSLSLRIYLSLIAWMYSYVFCISPIRFQQ
jgi:hypothetical protein